MVRELLLALAFAACTPASPALVEPADVVTIESDGGEASCATACASLRALSCLEGESSPGGVTCERVCAGAGQYLDVRCVSSAKTKPAMFACNVRCMQ